MINYVEGDATLPQGEGNKIIAHICNDIGAWGAGFVLAISRRWPQLKTDYRDWYLSKFDPQSNFHLGSVQLLWVEEDIMVANMIAQHGIRSTNKMPPIRYMAIINCLKKLAVMANRYSASIHMPYIGCGLAGGQWSSIEPLIEQHLVDKGLNVFVYNYKK